MLVHPVEAEGELKIARIPLAALALALSAVPLAAAVAPSKPPPTEAPAAPAAPAPDEAKPADAPVPSRDSPQPPPRTGPDLGAWLNAWIADSGMPLWAWAVLAMVAFLLLRGLLRRGDRRDLIGPPPSLQRGARPTPPNPRRPGPPPPRP